MKKIRVADYVAKFISDDLKVKDVFMVSGGGIMFLTDAVAQNRKLNPVCSHHEQTVAIALDAYSRVTQNMGVGLFTTGPGATNAITGLAGAWQDSVPGFFISGQSKRKETVHNSGVKGLRQYGIQEVDIIPVVKPLCKYAVFLNNPEEIRYELEKMRHIAVTGRPGPVWIDIPLDVQGALVDPSKLRGFKPAAPEVKDAPTSAEMAAFNKLLKAAKRPVLIAGHGIRLGKALPAFKRFAEKFQIPVVSTYLGVDVLPSGHPLYIGRVGIKGTRAGNMAVQNADLVVSVGSSLHVGSIGYEYDLFAPCAKKVVVDIDRTSHRKKTIKIDLYVNSDAGKFLGAALKAPRPGFYPGWAAGCRKMKAKYPVNLPEYAGIKSRVNIYSFVDALCAQLGGRDIVISDAGSAYYAVSQAVRVGAGQRYITSGSLGAMGYTLPAVIGAYYAARRRIVGITGDGSFQFNIQELQTIAHYGIPVKIFVLNNEGYLSIRTTQDKFFDKRFIGEGPSSGVTCPDTAKIAAAYGLKYLAVRNNGEMNGRIKAALDFKGPVLCEVFTPKKQLIIPTVASVKREDGSMVSRPLDDMFPFLPGKEQAENLRICTGKANV
ncbi:MAG: acetolactate synthase [Elusimicrobia bacterium HGW-Elusimicrobia-3]|jgi:acetolactate synthase-1/2/3 large subunit|nr:MAG: acetolactate synthase [Elusimicrobia bacterium HGW-Elusimicrobia-3]